MCWVRHSGFIDNPPPQSPSRAERSFMPPRSSWKGYIRLSLVSVPVKAYTASASGAEIRLNQLHKDCNNRVKYLKTCPEHGEISNADIVSGYEHAKGQYVVIDAEEVQKLRPKGDQSIHIKGFFDPGLVDPIYHAGKNYYLLPDGPVGQKPYALLRQGMVDQGVTAIAQVVLSGREQLVVLRPADDLIIMTVLNQEAKVKSGEWFENELVETKLTKEELALTKTLIDASTIEHFDYSVYKDDYIDKLTQVIQAKVEGEEIVQVPDPEEPKIINLMEALKASVARAQTESVAASGSGKKTARKASPKKMAPSAQKPAARRKKSG